MNQLSTLFDSLKDRISTLYDGLPLLIRHIFTPAGVTLDWLREASGHLYTMWERQDPDYVEPDSNENRQVDKTVGEIFFSRPSEVRCNVYIYTKRLSNSAIKLVNETSTGSLADQNSVSHWAIVVEYFVGIVGKTFAIYEAGRYNVNSNCIISQFVENVELETLNGNNYVENVCVGQVHINPVEAVQFCLEFTSRKLIYDHYKMNCQYFVKKFIERYVPASQVQWDKIRYDAEVANKLGAASKLASSGVLASAASVSV